MNTKTLFTVCLLLLGVALQAQELTKFKTDKGKWGFKNEKGTVIIEPKYDDIASFSEELVAVNIGKKGLFDSGGKWGFIDKAGNQVIDFLYDEVSNYGFNEGIAFVAIKAEHSDKGLKWGAIDKAGAEILPFQYDNAFLFSEGVAWVNLGGGYDEQYYFTGGKWALIDKKGQELIAPKYDDTDAFSEGLSAVKLNEKWGFVNQKGKETIPIQYYMVGTFSEGLVAVTKRETTKDFQWIFVDNKGKIAFPTEFEGMFAPVFKDGKAKVRKDGKTFYIDKTGKEVK